MKSHPKATYFAVVVIVFLTGCASIPPISPGVMALPGTGKQFDQFRIDDAECRNYAAFQSSGRYASGPRDTGVEGAAVGTLLGAAAGAAFSGSRGAAVGAGTGLLVGSSIGAGNANASSQEMQRQYDIAYTQCMYGKGNRVPISGRMTGDVEVRERPIPPPPAGLPPPPPPR